MIGRVSDIIPSACNACVNLVTFESANLADPMLVFAGQVPDESDTFGWNARRVRRNKGHAWRHISIDDFDSGALGCVQ